MTLKVYEYKNCGTCKKALKFLNEHNIAYQQFPIRETPPSKTELKQMLKFLAGDYKKLFNSSGQDYRELNIKDKLPHLNQDQVIELLANNGNLIKRPFVLGKDFGVVGFNAETWKKIFA